MTSGQVSGERGEAQGDSPRGPWRSLADAELTVAEWVAQYSTTRLHSAIGHLPPDELRARVPRMWARSHPPERPQSGAVGPILTE
ncbi:integrase core domain-containing protein [Nonomuraea sp. NPDC004580]|uniref:integrase core domain-containing protein n=1 Tax=Nonomuraea sp. NPDC004580 TaxID=3154552 RepID=UPI0033A8FAC4